MILFKRFLRLRAAAETGGAAGGTDRGDDWTPTDDEAAVDEKLGNTGTGELDELEPKKSALKTEADELKPEEEEEPKPKGKDKDTRIPAARHKEILDKERARREGVEAELAKYQQGGKIADMGAQITEAETRLIAMEKEYAKHMTDGDVEKAASTMNRFGAPSARSTSRRPTCASRPPWPAQSRACASGPRSSAWKGCTRHST